MKGIGRNDPCPCGSERKYKRCCIGKDPALSVPESGRIRLRQVEGQVGQMLLGFVKSHVGPGASEHAWRDFSLEGNLPADSPPMEQFFIPWFLFDWIPSPSPAPGLRSRSLSEPIALTYLAQKGDQLDDYQKSFIRTACREPFSFFLVKDVDPGNSISLSDLLLGRQVTVKERSGSRIVRGGEIIFGRALSLGGEAILSGLGPIALPPDYQNNLLDVRDDLRKTVQRLGFELNAESLRDFDPMLRSLYFAAVEQVLHPAPPVLQNTDGDPLMFIKLHYQLVCAPQEAVERLSVLVLPRFRENLLDDAERDREGRLQSVSFEWQKEGNRLHREWDNTTLGHIAISAGSLNVEVNSERREREIRKKIGKLLGTRAALQREERRSVEQMLAKESGRTNKSRVGRTPKNHEHSPEIRAVMEDQLKRHWEAWLDQPIPRLKNMTPRQAAQTSYGRERLEALLVEFEYRNQLQADPLLRADVSTLRRQLGL